MTVEFVIVAEVLSSWNMIILHLFHAEEVATGQIFSYFAKNVIEVNQTAAYVKYIIEKLERIAAIKILQPHHLMSQANARGLQKKVQDAEIKQRVQMVVVIYTKLEENLTFYEEDNFIRNRH